LAFFLRTATDLAFFRKIVELRLALRPSLALGTKLFDHLLESRLDFIWAAVARHGWPLSFVIACVSAKETHSLF
jgi:hypothetical protein